MDINPEQEKIINSEDKRIVVLACPGSGKTMTIVNKVLSICKKGTPFERVLMVTFTRKAADEMKSRLAKEMNIPGKSIRNISTLHSFGCGILYRYREVIGLCDDYEVALQTEKTELAKEVLFDDESQNDKATTETVNKFLEYVSCRKNGFLSSSSSTFTDDNFNDYNNRLIENGLIDIDDYIYLPVQILKASALARKEVQSRFSYIFVDEYQDINEIQNEFLDLIMTKDTNVMYVGDDDQSIYEFRGANPNYIRDKSGDDSEYTVYFLSRNYRSQKPIVELSKQVLADMKNKGRKEKTINSVKDTSKIKPVRPKEFPTHTFEADFVADEIQRLINETNVIPSEIAVLSRYRSKQSSSSKNHPELDLVEAALSKRGIKSAMSSSGTDSTAAAVMRQTISALSAFVSKDLKPEYCNALCENSYNANKFNSLVIEINNQYGVNIGTDNFKVSMDEIVKNDFELTSKNNTRLVRLKDAYKFLVKWRGQYLIGTPLSSLFLEYMTFILERYEERFRGYKEIYFNTYKYLRSTENHDAGMGPSRREGDIELIKQTSLYLIQYQADLSEHCVRLLTAHQSKGLQFDVVFVVGLQKGNFPNKHDVLDDEDLDNEKRLFYVCITRARELLYLTASSEFNESNSSVNGISFIEGHDELYCEKVESFEGITFSDHKEDKEKEISEHTEILKDFDKDITEEEKDFYFRYSMPEIADCVSPKLKSIMEKEWKLISSQERYINFLPAFRNGIVNISSLIEVTNNYVNGHINEAYFRTSVNTYNFKGGLAMVIINILQYFALSNNDGPVNVERFINAYLGKPDPSGRNNTYYIRLADNFRRICRVRPDAKLMENMSIMYAVTTSCNHPGNSSNPNDSNAELISYYKRVSKEFFDNLNDKYEDVFGSFFEFVELFLHEDGILSFAAQKMWS